MLTASKELEILHT